MSENGSSSILKDRDFNQRVSPGTVPAPAGAPAGPAKIINRLIGIAPKSACRLYRMNSDKISRAPRQATASGIGYGTGDRAAKRIPAPLPIADTMMNSKRISDRRFQLRNSEKNETAWLPDTFAIKAPLPWDVPAAATVIRRPGRYTPMSCTRSTPSAWTGACSQAIFRPANCSARMMRFSMPSKRLCRTLPGTNGRNCFTGTRHASTAYDRWYPLPVTGGR